MLHNKGRIYLLIIIVVITCIFSPSVLGAQNGKIDLLNYDFYVGNSNLPQDVLTIADINRFKETNKSKLYSDIPAFYCFKNLLEQYTFDSQLEARLFQLERTRLGADFEQELYRLVENNMYASYKCGMFLLKPTYLYGNSSAPKIALNVFELGLQVEADRENLKYRKVGLLVMAAVANQKHGDLEKAKRFKAEVEKTLGNQPSYSGGFPALVEQDRQIYNSIPLDAKSNKKLASDK